MSKVHFEKIIEEPTPIEIDIKDLYSSNMIDVAVLIVFFISLWRLIKTLK